MDLDLDAMFRLDGKVVVLTGASSGLGVRFAQLLDAAGAHVVLAARRASQLEAVAGGLERGIAVPCDVTDRADRDRCIDTALSITGRIDVLVNNAGLGEPMPAEDEPLDHFEAVVDVNLNALFAMSQLAGRHMIEQGGGVMVNIASILGIVSSAPIKQASYAASKAAVVNLTRELAVQWARKGIRVNAIAPGWFPSEMTTVMFEDEASIAYLRRNAPLGRGGDVCELDGALLLLAGPAGSYITGHTLVVDGGWIAH